MPKLSLVVLLILGFILVAPVGAQGQLSIMAGRQRVDTDPYSLVNEVNLLRSANGLPAYSINSILMSVAQQHAQYMAVAGVTHSGPGGSSPWQRGLAAGYPLAGDLSLGGFYSENIIAGNKMSVQEAVSAWQGDAPHLNTMLSPNLSEIGAGVALVGDYVYYVIDCAQPTRSSQAQANTLTPGNLAVTGSTATAAPVVVNTIIPATPLEDGRLIHVVKPGETLWLIAISYNVKIADLRRLNNLTETRDIYPGNKLLIRQELTPLAISATPTVTLQPTSTRVFTPIPVSPTLLPTSTLPAVASVSPVPSSLVLGVIIAAALLLAVVFVRAGRKI